MTTDERVEEALRAVATCVVNAFGCEICGAIDVGEGYPTHDHAADCPITILRAALSRPTERRSPIRVWRTDGTDVEEVPGVWVEPDACEGSDPPSPQARSEREPDGWTTESGRARLCAGGGALVMHRRQEGESYNVPVYFGASPPTSEEGEKRPTGDDLDTAAIHLYHTCARWAGGGPTLSFEELSESAQQDFRDRARDIARIASLPPVEEGERPVIVNVDDDWIFDDGAITFPADSAEDAQREIERLRAWCRAGPVEIRPADPPTTEPEGEG